MSNLSAPINIIYASTSGNTEYVMEKIAENWRAKGAEVVLHRSEQTSIDVITNNKFFLLAASTWDHGTLNPFFDKLCAEMEKADLTGKTSSFIGLGDRRYEKHYFCTAMTILKDVWEKSNGLAIGVPLTIGRDPFEEQITTMFGEWADKTFELYKDK